MDSIEETYLNNIKNLNKRLDDIKELIRIEEENFSNIKSSFNNPFKEAFDALIDFIRKDKRYLSCKYAKNNSSLTISQNKFDYLNSTYKDQKYLVVDCANKNIFFQNDLDYAYHLYDTYIIEIKTKHIWNVQKVGMAETFNERS